MRQHSGSIVIVETNGYLCHVPDGDLTFTPVNRIVKQIK